MFDRLKEGFNFLRVDRAGVSDPALWLARCAVIFLLAVLPFSHNAALKNFAILGMLTAVIWLMVHRRLAVDWHSPILRAIAGLLLVLVVTAALGTEPANSLGELRKHFLPGVLMLLLIPVAFQGERLMRLVLAVSSLAFMLRAGLTLVELAHYYPDLDSGRSDGHFIKGFSMDASFYVPALIGLLLLGRRWRWLAPLGLLAVMVVVLLVESRTPLVASLIAVLVMLVVLRQWRTLFIGFVAATLVGGYFAASHPQIVERFASILRPQTYVAAFDTENYTGAEGLAARMPIWLGVVEVTSSRSLIGYGFGWKKLGKLAVDDGYVARWAAQENNAFAQEQAWYFSLPPAKVNPHNLYLQIYFESGLVGLLAYALMLLVLFWQALRFSWHGQRNNRIIAAVTLAYLVGHVILGLANGLWIGLGPSLALIALLETVRRSEKNA